MNSLLPAVAPFPASRPRRLRAAPWIRAMVRESVVTPRDLIWPIFIVAGEGVSEPIAAMPGVDRMSVDVALRRAETAHARGVGCVALFPSVAASLKTAGCEEAWNPDSLVCRATRAFKAALPDLGVMLDVALDPYSAHGHDGLVRDGRVDNDASVDALTRQALVQAEAGADILGPSDMMDGRIARLRGALEAAGFHDVILMSYAAKYASAFYGPFRSAVGAAGKLGLGDAPDDKKTYQLDPGNGDEALREVAADLAEGADMVMVKPGLAYLDICARVKAAANAPLAAYHVSGEYAMLEAAAANGWLNRRDAVEESLLAFKRAGCDAILTYYAAEVAGWRAQGRD